MRLILLFSCIIMLSGCLSGGVNYVKPIQPEKLPTNSAVVSKSKDVVWKELVPEIGKTFWVINNIDKDSGLINISYSGDPELYVNCGEIHSTVNNARGERVYNFQASKAYQQYEIADGYILVFAERKMNLEGRVNIIVQEISPGQTQFTINPKFVLTKLLNLRNTAGGVRVDNDTISFSSGQVGRFVGGTECISNGQLEASILGMIQVIKNR